MCSDFECKPSESSPVLFWSLKTNLHPTVCPWGQRLGGGVEGMDPNLHPPPRVGSVSLEQETTFFFFFLTLHFLLFFSFMIFFFRLCAELVSYKVLYIKMSLYRCPVPHPKNKTTHTVRPPPHLRQTHQMWGLIRNHFSVIKMSWILLKQNIVFFLAECLYECEGSSEAWKKKLSEMILLKKSCSYVENNKETSITLVICVNHFSSVKAFYP